MTVRISLHCGGCDAVANDVGRIRREFVSFSGRGYGFGRTHDRVEIDTPPGWVAFDPWTYCTYCPTCWAEIQCPVLRDGALEKRA